MNKLEREMYKAMQDSGWWPVGEEAIEDMTKIAMSVANKYIDEVHGIMLCGHDDSVKLNSISYMHNDLIGDTDDE